MKMFICLIFVCISVTTANAQDPDYAKKEQLAEAKRCAQYKEVVAQIFKDDELFVLFYLNLALVVDPTKETQVVERITTDNPWESLTDYIKGKSNIYFCPSGSQLSKAIEYMPCPIDLDILMSDKYGMYRLSSPEELFKNRGDSFRNSKHKAVVFGGLKYDEESIPITDNLLAFRGNRKAMEGYQYLKSTYEEAIYIDSIFRRNGIETALLTGDDGTEQSFAQIPKHQVDIIHVASHGFYEPDKDNTESSSLQEWMMSHAGLVLAGAERETTNRSNDGRLTAYEISQTDLSGVNLVVLSACDTGLGDVKENDVYGLLKGFKKAGAGTMLVTLSEVNDTVTSLLMKRFYDNLFRGDNPRRALENAQRYVRLIGKGQYNKPEYWTPFVLVDDLDRNIGKKLLKAQINLFLNDIIEVQNVYSEKSLFPNWKQIRQKLSSKDAVIRFFSYKVGRADKYVALIGDVSDGHCNVVRLFSIKNYQLEGLDEYEQYSFERFIKSEIFFSYRRNFELMDSILWKPILPYISSKHYVYFQPEGIINYFPIEAYNSVEEAFKLYRLSSLNRLFAPKERIRFRNNSLSVLFGGLDYTLNDEHLPQKPLNRGVKHRIRFKFLETSKSETDSIFKMLKEMRMKTLLYQGSHGTESAYRSLFNGNNISTIHLSTHTFDMMDNDFERKGGEKEYSISGYLLNLHAIALSGAQMSWESEMQNDGILLGGDIANLDHSKVQLVSLYMGDERRFLLQRGMTDTPWNLVRAFKMSGVKAILYPLWPTDDEATVTLIVEFYRYFVTGHTLNESLEYAKMFVRKQKEKGWDDPKYWASFVLIDAIE